MPAISDGQSEVYNEKKTVCLQFIRLEVCMIVAAVGLALTPRCLRRGAGRYMDRRGIDRGRDRRGTGRNINRRGTDRGRDRVSWCFTPSQPVRQRSKRYWQGQI